MISDGNVRRVLLGSSLIASKHKLDNLVLIVDYNKIQHYQTFDALPLDNYLKNFIF